MRMYAKLHLNLAWCLRGARTLLYIQQPGSPLVVWSNTYALLALQGRNISALNGPHGPQLRCLLYTLKCMSKVAKKNMTVFFSFFPAFGNFV